MSQRLSETIPGATNVYRLVTISGCHSGEGEGSGAASHHLCRRHRPRPCLRCYHHLRRYLSREGERCSKRGETRPGWPAARRCLASTEIKNIDSHSHAGLHRSSIRFSPARQYPFFPRTVRGTNCSCIPAPALPLSPPPRTGIPNTKALFFIWLPSPSPSSLPFFLPYLPTSYSLDPRTSFGVFSSSCLRSLVRCATCPNVWRRNAIHN